MRLPNFQSFFDRLTQTHIILILIFSGLLAYGNAVNHPFVHDDVVFIQMNPHIGDLNLKHFFYQTSFPDSEFPLVNQYYRPLLELTNRVLYRIVHLNPHGFHFFNILLHILNSFLVYKVLQFLTANKNKLSLAAAILFLVHPIQSEAVACISGISNLLFAFLCLASFYWYLKAVHGEESKNNKRLYIGSLALFFLALLAKEQSIVLPVIIVFYEICYSKKIQHTFKEKIPYIAGFFIILLGYFLLRKFLFGFSVTPYVSGDSEYLRVLLSIPRSILTYLGLIFFPRHLHYYRSQDILLPYMGSILLFCAVVILTIYIIYRVSDSEKRWMAFGVFWFGIALLPTLNIVPLINEYSKILTSEHFLYLPIVGVFLFVIGLISKWIKRTEYTKCFSVCFITMGLVTAIFLGMTMKLNTYWRGEVPLFEQTLKYENDFGRVRFLLSKAYAAEGRIHDSVIEAHKALSIMEGYAQKVTNEKIKEFYLGFIMQINYHLGYCYDRLNQQTLSLNHFKAALALNEENEAFHHAVGLAYVKVMDSANAAKHFERVIDLNKNNLMVMNNLALCYQDLGQWDKAEEYLRTIVGLDKQSTSAKANLESFLRKREISRGSK